MDKRQDRSLALLGLVLLAGANLTAQPRAPRYKVGDRVEVDTLFTSPQSDPSKSMYWRAGTVTEIYNPENQFGGYVVRVDSERRDYRVRFVDPQWIRPATAGSVAPGNPPGDPRATAGQPVATANAGAVQGQPSRIGALYQTRDPHTCGSTKAPGNGPPSQAIVREAILCTREHERRSVLSGTLYLIENLNFDIASKGRPFNLLEDRYMSDVDVDVPIYQLRGSVTSYQCDPATTTNHNIGRNCTRYEEGRDSGQCYKTTFGDWKCNLSGNATNTTREVPGPR